MISGLLLCDFCVDSIGVQSIYLDVRFWEKKKLEKQLTMFFGTNVLPEVMFHELQRSFESGNDSD